MKAQSHLPEDIHLEAGTWPQASLFSTPDATSLVPTLGSEAGSFCPSLQISLQPLLRLPTLVDHEVAIPKSPAAPAPPELSSSSERGQILSLPSWWLAEPLLPACCLADGEINPKPFPAASPHPSHPHLRQDHADCPRGTWSTKSNAEAGQLAQLPAASGPSASRRREDFRALLESYLAPLFFCRFRLNKLLLHTGGWRRIGS